MSYLSLLPMTNALLCAGLGVFTLLRNLRQPSNVGFAIGLLCVAAMEAGCAMVIAAPFMGRFTESGIRLNIAGQAFLPASWALFSSVFARARSGKIPPILISALIGLTLISVLMAFFSWSPAFFDIITPDEASWSVLPDPSAVYSLGPAGKYFYIYIILGLTFNLVNLENTLRSSAGQKRWQIKYIIFGVGGISAFYIVLSSQILLFSGLNTEMLLLASAVTFISVTVTGVFIVRNRLLDVDIFISRYVVYNSLTLLAVGVYLMAVGLIVKGIRLYDLPVNNLISILFIFVSLFALTLLFFTSTLRRKAQLFINRHFYRHKYEFRDKWMETTEKISSKGDIGEIVATLEDLVTGTVGARSVHIWLHEPVTNSFVSANGRVSEAIRSIGEGHPLLERINKDKAPFNISEMMGYGAQSPLASMGAVLCAPMSAGDELVGFALIGGDFSGEPYQGDDFDILKAMATQAAVQIRNLRSAQDLMSMKTVESFSRISAFIMHDLKNLTNSLSLVSQNARDNMDNPDFQRDAIRTIDATVGRMKSVISRLSAAPEAPAVRLQEADLGALLAGVLKKSVFTEEKALKVSCSIEDLPAVRIDPDAMEMVFLNIISNSFEALQAAGGEIAVAAGQRNGAVVVTISDTGAGMAPEFVRDSLFKPFITTKKSGFGIGLYQCRGIVEAHGGRIEVQSEPGKGTSFRVVLPLSGQNGR